VARQRRDRIEIAVRARDVCVEDGEVVVLPRTAAAEAAPVVRHPTSTPAGPRTRQEKTVVLGPHSSPDHATCARLAECVRPWGTLLDMGKNVDASRARLSQDPVMPNRCFQACLRPLPNRESISRLFGA
jgi:hypothetical protein